MEININHLLEYFNKFKFPVNIAIGLANEGQIDQVAVISFIMGDDMEGSNRRHLTIEDLQNILYENKVINSKDEFTNRLKDANTINSQKVFEKLRDDIYSTLAKYVINLFYASRDGKRLYKEIIPLKSHKAHYFSNDESLK
jgi:hypothetical protein